MQIEKLQIELRPRSDAQALDLGFALLRARASAAYKAFLVLWVPLNLVCAALMWFFPKLYIVWLVLPWWFRPYIERAPLYVISRQIFGTYVTWQEAVRAWRKQLGGGWVRLLLLRPLAAGRGLYQPVWQLELARGSASASRVRDIGKQGTGASAFWFGLICFCLELVLEFGVTGLASMFFSDSAVDNPFALFSRSVAAEADNRYYNILMLGLYAIAAGVMAPVYTACCFTLYLNRRATLEAWDIEMKLRQLRAPAAAKPRSGGGALLAGALLLACMFMPAPPAEAAVPAKCAAPEGQRVMRAPAQDEEQKRIRQQVDQVYATPELRGYECVETWHFKETKKKKKEPPKPVDSPSLELFAGIFKALLIALAFGLVAWLVYHNRASLAFFIAPRAALATEVGGLDIRAASLPPDVTASVRALWAKGDRRAALALLYRATISRLVSEHALVLRQGATEGDCLRLARQAAERIGVGRVEVAAAATALWLNGAYGDRWPDETTVFARCSEWDAQFGGAA